MVICQFVEIMKEFFGNPLCVLSFSVCFISFARSSSSSIQLIRFLVIVGNLHDSSGKFASTHNQLSVHEKNRNEP